MTTYDTTEAAVLQRGETSPAPAMAGRVTMADPTPIAFGLFAFALTVYGVRFVGVDAASIHGPTSDALNYAILVAGIGQLLAGLFATVRGISYRGWVTSIFGVWLIGFYLLLTHEDTAAARDSGILAAGPDGKPLPSAVAAALQAANVTAWRADSVAWYVLLLIVPVAILAVPSFRHRNVPFMIGFTAIVVLLVLLGTAFQSVYGAVTDVTRGRAQAPDLNSAVSLLHASAWAAFVAAVSIFWVFGREVVLPSGAAERH